MTSETESIEHKRKRQDSIQGAEVLADTSSSSQASQASTPEPTVQPGSSPVKRPRANEEDDAVHSPNKPTSAVFGTKFSSGLGFASTAKPSGFAAYTASGFAKYAEEPAVKSPQGTKTFEDLLTAEGRESLASNAALSAVVPAMAQANVSPPPNIPIRTFEEDETCIYSSRSKLFELVDGNWKERGSGVFKINRHNEDGKRRLVMRTDQTFRLILNVGLFPGMKASCERRFVRFTIFDEAKAPVTFVLRFASEELADEALDNISRNIPETSEVAGGSDQQQSEEDEDEDEDETGEGTDQEVEEEVEEEEEAEDEVEEVAVEEEAENEEAEQEDEAEDEETEDEEAEDEAEDDEEAEDEIDEEEAEDEVGEEAEGEVDEDDADSADGQGSEDETAKAK
ncbi:hypothetical protein GGI25_004736 [Coemansia spiralis]|uniref:RanBD1 domain-containing protein n=1 Tax=Coemansia spiralis TaxID=417178 RepID=A0A9W8FZV7_9FUNG|nr:hypothetical protein GGI25_004736 [Coemansia spiralis]